MPPLIIDPSSQQEFSDADFAIVDNADQSKKLKWQLSALTTATTRTWTVPDADVLIAWLFQAVSVDEGAGTAVFRMNGSTSSKTGTFTSPSSSNASARLTIRLEEGRVAAVAMWEGVALSAANITSIYDVIRSKYGL